jgi:hypothetical protein
MCGSDPADRIISRPDGLRCDQGRVQGGALATLGTPDKLPGSCSVRIEAMLRASQAQPASEPPPDPKITCRQL